MKSTVEIQDNSPFQSAASKKSVYARAVVTRCELRVNKGRAVSHHHTGFTQRASCVASARLKRELYFLDAAFRPFTLRSSTQEGLGTPYQPENLYYMYDDTS